MPKKPASAQKKSTKPKKQPTTDRARFIIDQCPHKITGEVNIPGLQLNAPEHESELERQSIHLLALCKDVIGISSQPEKIKLTIPDKNGKSRYTTDLLVTLENDEKIRVEIKPIAHVLGEEMLEKLVQVADHYLGINQRFDILTEDAIQLQPRLSIAMRLRGFLVQEVPQSIRDRINSVLAKGGMRIEAICSELEEESTFSHVLALVAQRHLCISWKEPLTQAMSVSLPNHPFPHLSYAAITSASRFRSLISELVLGRRPSNQRLLAAARAEDRSVCLPSPVGVSGALPKRGMQVGRGVRGGGVGGDGSQDASTTRSPSAPAWLIERGGRNGE